MLGSSRRVGPTGAAVLAPGVLALGVAGCAAGADPAVAPAPPSLAQSASGSVQSSPAAGTWQALGLKDLPFDLEIWVDSDPGDGAQSALDHAAPAILDAADSVAPGVLHQFSLTGQTPVDESGLPGPAIRAVLNSDYALAGLMEPILGVEITDLAQLPSTLGTVNAQGVFEALEFLSNPAELPDSNPDALYFEPQDFGVNENWVVWREGSAGDHGRMPTIETDDWRVVGWDQGQEEATEYASAYLLHGDRFAPRAPEWAVPSTDGEFIYFSAALPEEMLDAVSAVAEGGSPCRAGVTPGVDQYVSDGWRTGVLRVALADPGAVEVIAQGAVPAADVGGVGAFWVEVSSCLVRDGQPFMRATGEGAQISTVAVSTDLVVFGVDADAASDAADGAWLVVWDRNAESVAAVIRSTGDWISADVNGSTVVWGNGSANSDPAMYMWVLGDSAPTVLGSVQGMSNPKYADGLLAIPAETSDGALQWALYRVD